MLSQIRLCHADMIPVVKVSGGTTDETNIRNGIRQDEPWHQLCSICTLHAAILACWRSQCPEAGVIVRYRIGRRLLAKR